jgi:hypothetical protein
MKEELPEQFKNVIKKWEKSYISILFLTLHYQDKEGGLRLLHYRYALVKKDDISTKWKEKMNIFFGWKLRELYNIREVRKCISTRQNLVKKLHNLVEWDIIKPIPKTYDRDYPLYRIKEENFKKIDLIMRKNRLKKLFEYTIDQYMEEQINRVENNIEDFLGIKKPEPPRRITEELAKEILKT